MAIIRVTLPDCGGCCGCPSAEELELTLSGFSSCGCITTFNPSLGSFVVSEVRNLVIPATLTLTLTAPDAWSGTGGSFDMFYDATGNCGLLAFDASGDITFTAYCFDGVFTIEGGLSNAPITFDPAALGDSGFPTPPFETTLNVPATDIIGCNGNTYARGGTVTISLP